MTLKPAWGSAGLITALTLVVSLLVDALFAGNLSRAETIPAVIAEEQKAEILR
jgi:hypothetical protein